MRKSVRVLMLALVALGASGTAVLGQGPGPAANAAGQTDSAEGAAVRFTPGMARAMGHLFADDVLRKRYDLPLERKDEAAEAIAGRLMRMAHASEQPAQGLFEFYFGQAMEIVADMREGEQMRGIPPQFGVGFGQRALPMLPAVRDLIRDVGQDVRPMLPMKGQLKLGTDLLTVKAGVDAFEGAMQRWSQGNVNLFENPFSTEDKIKTDETGQSEQFKGAVKHAQQQLDYQEQIERWRRYVAKAKALYEFDEPQSATADSILSEAIERAERTSADQTRRERAYRTGLWREMASCLPMGWQNPAYCFIQKQQEAAAEPIVSLEEELKRRIDRIPTQVQRLRADEKVMAAFTEQGLETEATESK